MIERLWQIVEFILSIPILRGLAVACSIGAAVGLLVGIKAAAKDDGRLDSAGISSADRVNRIQDDSRRKNDNATE